MTVLIVEAAATVALLLAGGSSVDDAALRAPAPRMLYVCQNDAATKRALKRQQGVEVKFETARSVLNAGSERWDAPRCITAAELRRLDAMSDRVAYVGEPAPSHHHGMLIAAAIR